MLKTLTRTTGSTTQSYNFTYDSFGNMKTLKVGSRTLATYTYGDKNGQLKTQTYGNGDSTSFQYDSLNRTTSTTTSSGDSYNYFYAGDGQLYKMEDTAAGMTYRYNYDSIGRLIGTNQTGGAADLRAAYGYDNESRLKSINYSIPGVVDSATETFYYNTSTTDSISDGALTSMALFSNEWIYYRYDSLSRLKERDVGGILTEHQTYLAGTNGCTTTTLPETFYTTAKGSSTKLSGFQYAYNEVGNVTQITNLLDNSYWKFAYDKMGQMQYATDYAADGTARGRYKYYYDNAGNLTSWKIQDGSATVTQEEHTYTYGDSNWKDLLTAFDGQTITYDGGGNPLSYYNGRRYTMTWRNGRELNTATVGGKTYSYEYDVNGLRTRKTNSDGGYTQYYIVDGLTVAEQRFTSTGAEMYTLRYLYDESNSPVGFGIQYPGGTTWTNYYFAKNLQGDVIALYLWNGTSTGTLVATYKYDPWGKPIGIYNASGATISQTAANVAAYNPFRYRGYRYDADTGFYYLQSRYYDPAICRFINADRYTDTGEKLVGYNMFVYCNNNSIVYTDFSGERAMGPSFYLVNDGGTPRINPFTSYSGGDIYVVKQQKWSSTKYQIQSQLLSGDVLIVDCRANTDNPNIQIVDSYKLVYLHVHEEVVDALLQYVKENPDNSGWDRERQDMLYEWNYHNMAYSLGFGKERAQSVDLDKADENKPAVIKFIEIIIEKVRR